MQGYLKSYLSLHTDIPIVSPHRFPSCLACKIPHLSLFYIFKSIFLPKVGDASLKYKLSTSISSCALKESRVGAKSMGEELHLLGLVLGILSDWWGQGLFLFIVTAESQPPEQCLAQSRHSMYEWMHTGNHFTDVPAPILSTRAHIGLCNPWCRYIPLTLTRGFCTQISCLDTLWSRSAITFYRWATWDTEGSSMKQNSCLLSDSFTNIMAAGSFHSTLSLLVVLLHHQEQLQSSNGLKFIYPSTHPTSSTFTWYHHVPGSVLGSRKRGNVGK